VKGGSIRFRLWSAAAISILIALGIAGIGLRYLFERHVERRIETELTVDLNQLIGATSFVDGSLTVATVLANPSFSVPLSGYYWQVQDVAKGTLVRSRSLWDTPLDLPAASAGQGAQLREVTGPGGALLVAVDRTVVDGPGRVFRAVVAEDHRTVEQSVDEYVRELAPAIVILAAVLIAAIFFQITIGLAPMQGLETEVRDVVGGRRARLETKTPKEVQPLADEINRLLEVQEKALSRARSRAADLAHGLKTPLQILSGDIRRLRQRGETRLADDIEKSTTAIQRHAERELARVRVAPGTAAAATASRVAEVAQQVIAVIQRAPTGERLAFTIDAADNLTADIDEGDLTEIFGNLMENAARFASSAVYIRASADAGATRISITDDGPGIPQADLKSALSRGVSLDASGAGTGLGLAIVSDIVSAYGGGISLDNAVPGLRVTITLPRRC
jgi:signal transduction histidine kinase